MAYHSIMMATTLKVAIIQWDSLLDRLEEIIGREKCIVCRAVQYYRDFSQTTSTAHVYEFQYVQEAYRSLMHLCRAVTATPLVIRYCCHQQNHGRSKVVIRALMDAEKKLMISLHYHPLIKDVHVCYLCYADAVHYNVESAACDEMFIIKQTMEYVSQLCTVRRLFE